VKKDVPFDDGRRHGKWAGILFGAAIGRASLPAPAEDGGWERFGIHGRALEAEELASTRADIVRRVEAMIGSARAAA
jgi:hypothetical protein